MYTQPATTLTPALVIYLIDASDSMNEPCGSTTKIAMVNSLLQATLRDMARRCMRGGVLRPRYKIAILAYSRKVLNVLQGVRDLPTVLQQGMPELTASGVTDTEEGFTAVEQLLKEQLPDLMDSPAPLVCHLTDAGFTTKDPAPIIQRIQALGVNDGPTLVEHIYVADHMLRIPTLDWTAWGGARNRSELNNPYARYLFSLASLLPETYRHSINDYGYTLQPGAKLFFPGAQADLMRLAFVASTATQMK